MKTRFVAIGALFGLLGVALGAFGAHGLKGHIEPAMMAVYHTAVLYHLVHALGVLIIGLVAEREVGRRLCRWSGLAMSWGIVIFSGSLYLLVITGLRWLGMITPIGGVLFIVAWGLLILATWKTVTD